MRRVAVIILVISAIIIMYWYFIASPFLNEDYNGVVTQYWYDEKGYVSYKLNNNGFDIQTITSLQCDMKLQDSILKRKGDNFIYHFRNGKLICKYNPIGFKFK